MPYAFNRRVRIYWEEEGSGDPLLLIMGLSFSMAMWSNLRPFLARHFRLILLDNRCVGKSAVPLRPFSMAAMAEDAVCVLDAAGIQSADVFGISMGGMIAQEIAVRKPSRVRKLILGCTHAGGLQSVRPDPDVIRVMTSPFMSRSARLRAILPFIYDAHTPQERIDRDLEIVRANVPTRHAYLQQLAAILAWNGYASLPRITAPTLVIHGETDRLIPPANASILASRIPGARLVLLPQASHVFPTDQPEKTRKELLEFLLAGSRSTDPAEPAHSPGMHTDQFDYGSDNSSGDTYRRNRVAQGVLPVAAKRLSSTATPAGFPFLYLPRRAATWEPSGGTAPI
jgi:pimeloyl-ACP methyl ester carboxylesterase